MNMIGLFLGALISISCLANAPHSGGKAHRDNGALFPTPKANVELAKMPGSVKIEAPAFNSSVSGDAVQLKWSEVAGAETYYLQVATDPNFKWLTTDVPLFKGTSYDLKGLEAGKHYYWRVSATKQSNWTNASKGPFATSMFATK